MTTRRPPQGVDAAGQGPLRRRLSPEARRAQLVRLGVDLVKVRPFDQLLLDEVIESAGISKGLLFHYFPTKRDFQLAVIAAVADELCSRVEPDRSLGLADQLRYGVDAYVAYIEEWPAGYTAIVRGAGSDDALLALFEQTRDALVDIVAAPLASRSTPVLRLLVRGWLASVEEATILWLRGTPRACERAELVDLLVRAGMALLPIIDEILEAEATP